MPDSRFPILLITSTRIGDAVLASGLLRRLIEEVPNARFTIVAGPLAAPLFRDTPGLDALIPLPKEKHGMHWLRLWAKLRSRRYGLIVDLRNSPVSRFLSAQKRALKRSSSSVGVPVHKVVEAARVLKLEDVVPAPMIYTSPETEAAADLIVGQGGPILAIGPAANWVGKTWPAERFAVAAADLLGPNGPMPDGRLMVVGGPDDRWAAEAVRRVIARDRLIDLVGRTDLLTVFACLKRARLFIGNDSGLMHMAAAAGAPTLGLFGPSDDRLYGPWGRHARALRGPREFESFVASDPELNQAVCHMLDLPVEWVVRAARALYAESEADWRSEHGDRAPPPTPITFVRTAEPEAQRPAPPDWDPSVLGDAPPRARSGMSAASFRPTRSEPPTPAPLTFRAAPADTAARPPAPVPPADLSEPIVAPVLPKRRAAVRQPKSSAAAAVIPSPTEDGESPGV